MVGEYALPKSCEGCESVCWSESARKAGSTAL